MNQKEFKILQESGDRRIEDHSMTCSSCHKPFRFRCWKILSDWVTYCPGCGKRTKVLRCNDCKEMVPKEEIGYMNRENGAVFCATCNGDPNSMAERIASEAGPCWQSMRDSALQERKNKVDNGGA